MNQVVLGLKCAAFRAELGAALEVKKGCVPERPGGQCWGELKLTCASGAWGFWGPLGRCQEGWAVCCVRVLPAFPDRVHFTCLPW